MTTEQNIETPLQAAIDRAGLAIEHAHAFIDAWLTPDGDSGRFNLEAPRATDRFVDGLRDTLEPAERALAWLPVDCAGKDYLVNAWELIGGARELLLACTQAGMSPLAGAALWQVLATAETLLDNAKHAQTEVLQ